jgi:hypothetical protein
MDPKFLDVTPTRVSHLGVEMSLGRKSLKGTWKPEEKDSSEIRGVEGVEVKGESQARGARCSSWVVLKCLFLTGDREIVVDHCGHLRDRGIPAFLAVCRVFQLHCPREWGPPGRGSSRSGLEAMCAWVPPVSLVTLPTLWQPEPLPGIMGLLHRPWAWDMSGEGVMWLEQLVEARKSGG